MNHRITGRCTPKNWLKKDKAERFIRKSVVCRPGLAISAASYRGAKCPTLKTAGKTAEKGAEWVTVKQPKNSKKKHPTTRKTVKTAVLTVFRVFFRLFFGCFTVTHSAPFSAVFPAVFNVGHLAPL